MSTTGEVERTQLILGAMEAHFRVLPHFLGEKKDPGVVLWEKVNETKWPRIESYRFVEYRVVFAWYKPEFPSGRYVEEETIFHGELPIWHMVYFGSYPSALRAHLRTVCGRSCFDRVFNGGRGPCNFPIAGYVYENVIKADSFTRFHGSDRLIDPRIREPIGQGDYMGGSFR